MIERTAAVDLAFWAIAAITVSAAVMVVTTRDVFKASVFLAASFLSVAALYALLQAEFLAAVQVLIYVGAISILIAFTVMMVRHVSGGNRAGGPLFAAAGGVAAVIVTLVIAFAAYNTNWSSLDAAAASDERVAAGTAGQFQAEPWIGNRAVDIVAVPVTDPAEAEPGVFERTTNHLGKLLIRDYAMAFEVVSIVLLAALIGALAVSRESGRVRSRT